MESEPFSEPGHSILGADPEKYHTFSVGPELAAVMYVLASERTDITVYFAGPKSGEAEPSKKNIVYNPDEDADDKELFIQWVESLQPGAQVTVQVISTERPTGSYNPIIDFYNAAEALLAQA